MSAASENLKCHQRQLDMDGVEVGVSRQAIDETLDQYGAMLAALKAIRNGLADTKSTPGQWMTRIKKPDAYEIARAAIAKADGGAP